MTTETEARALCERLSGGPVRYAAVEGQTIEEMRAAFHKHPLYRLGDARLVWVSESDLDISYVQWEAKAAIEALLADKARVVAWLRKAQAEEQRRSIDNAGTQLGSCAAYAAIAIGQEADAIEAGRIET
jgi:hypothetical protein